MGTDYTPSQIEAAAVFMAMMQPNLLQGMTFKQAGEEVLKRVREIVQLIVSDQERITQISDMIARRIHGPCKAAAEAIKCAKVAAEDSGYNQL